MVWYGMVWYGMVWYGIVWCGMVWYGIVWYGTVWYGMVWYGMVWYVTVMLCNVMLLSVLFCSVYMLCYNMLCCVMLCYVTLRYVMLCCVMFYVMLWYKSHSTATDGWRSLPKLKSPENDQEVLKANRRVSNQINDLEYPLPQRQNLFKTLNLAVWLWLIINIWAIRQFSSYLGQINGRSLNQLLKKEKRKHDG